MAVICNNPAVREMSAVVPPAAPAPTAKLAPALLTSNAMLLVPPKNHPNCAGHFHQRGAINIDPAPRAARCRQTFTFIRPPKIASGALLSAIAGKMKPHKHLMFRRRENWNQ